MKLKALAVLTALLLATGVVVGVRTNADASTTQTATCTDDGGHLWTIRSVWGETYDSGGVTKIRLNPTGFTSAAADATTADWSMRVYDATGDLLQKTGGQDSAFDFEGGGAYLDVNLADPPSAPGEARVVVNVGDGNDRRGNCTVTLVQPSDEPTPPDPTASAPVVAAVGDIACAPGVPVTPTSCQHKAVADKILATNPSAFLALGDLQYHDGNLSAFNASYDAAFAQLKAITKPIPGNHEYRTPGASGYYDYFGTLAGDRTKGYYSFDVGPWHFVALNSEKDVGADGEQVAWLKADLAANSKNCVAAIWHKPRWSTGAEHGDDATVQPFVSALVAAEADLILNGHDHDYERFYPLDASGARDDTNGITQIVSGLGGKDHYRVRGRATTAAKNDSGFGFVQLVLHDGSADISYVPAVGSYTDSTTLTCHS